MLWRSRRLERLPGVVPRRGATCSRAKSYMSRRRVELQLLPRMQDYPFAANARTGPSSSAATRSVAIRGTLHASQLRIEPERSSIRTWLLLLLGPRVLVWATIHAYTIRKFIAESTLAHPATRRVLRRKQTTNSCSASRREQPWVNGAYSIALRCPLAGERQLAARGQPNLGARLP